MCLIRVHLQWLRLIVVCYQSFFSKVHSSVYNNVHPTAAAPASEGEAIVRSPTKMAAAKIVYVDFIDLY